MTLAKTPRREDRRLALIALGGFASWGEMIETTLDGLGTTVYSHAVLGNGLRTSSENPPCSATHTVTVTNRLGRRAGLTIQQPSGQLVVTNSYDGAGRWAVVGGTAGTFSYRYPQTASVQPIGITLPGGGDVTNWYDEVGAARVRTLRQHPVAVRSTGGSEPVPLLGLSFHEAEIPFRSRKGFLRSLRATGKRLHEVSLLTIAITMLGAASVSGQTIPEILSASLRLETGPMFTFQFRASGGPAEAYVLETTPETGAPGTWSEPAGTRIEAIAENLFRATLPAQTDRLFCRVRVVDPGLEGPPLWINEVMTDNVSAFPDSEGEFWDWIELYNPNDEAVRLDGYALTDDESLPDKWRFPAALIQPLGYVVVFASDLDRTNGLAPWHTNFKLKAAGEVVRLSDAALRPLDRFQVPALGPDQSVGRVPDGSTQLQVYAKADVSPGRENPVAAAAPALPGPAFSPEGGLFSAAVAVQVTAGAPDHRLHYTLDGSVPSAQSPVLSSPLTLQKSAVVRVIAMDGSGRRSAVESRSYLIGAAHGLPVLALAIAPSNLAFRDGYLHGMGPNVLSSQNQVLQDYPYYGSNAWQDREVEVGVEFFEPWGALGFRQRAGLKIFGGWGSRGYPQKSLALFARRAYGAGKFAYRVFPEQDVDGFEALILRNSGNDNQGTHQTPPRPPITAFGPTASYGSYFVNSQFTLMRDALMQRLVGDTGLDTQGYRPAVVYVNGEYWGLYNLREKLNEDYVSAHHGLARGNIDLIEGYGTVNAGTGTFYNQMRQFIASRNMADDANYAVVAETYLDIANFIDYHLAVIYFQNFDIGNIKCWRPRLPRGRFRWLVFDQDYGFNLWPPDIYVPAMARDYADYDNMFRFCTAAMGTSTGWPNAGGRTLLLRSLLQNARFKERFIRRGADLLNSLFREERVQDTIQAMAAVIRPEIARHLDRWSWAELTRRGFGKPHQAEFRPFTQATWETHIEGLSAFAHSRPAKLRQDCMDHFRLVGGLGTLAVRVQPEGAGRVQVNSLTLDQFPWQGVYFADLANTLRPIPHPGYRFVDWIAPSGSASEHTLNLSVQRDLTNTVTARFEPAPSQPAVPSELVITEIQYHPAATRDSGDWIELYHPGATPLDLSGWIFRDEEDDHAFPLPQLTLPPGGFLVLCQEDARFRISYPATVVAIGDFAFGLGNGGDTLRLFRPDGTVAIALTYHDTAPWPEAADGTGFTLELADPGLDPTDPGSWRASALSGGTPGR